MEIWKNINGYEGLYQVSNEGRVKSLERTVVYKDGRKKVIKPNFLMPHKNTNGHLDFRLSKNGVTTSHLAHHIVAEAFIPNPNNYDVVHHIDHDKHNNKVENLKWMSGEEHRGLHIKEIRSKTVYQYSLDGELIGVWESVEKACRELGANHSHISNCCLGKRKTHKGYRWSYKPL